MFLKSKNLIILTNYFTERTFRESYSSVIDEAEEMEIEDLLMPPIYCENADIKKVDFVDGTVLYIPKYNIDFEVIEEGEI